MPRMVVVEIDSIRMFYPSCLICVTLDEDGHCHSVNNPNDILPNLTPSELIGRSFFVPNPWEMFIFSPRDTRTSVDELYVQPSAAPANRH